MYFTVTPRLQVATAGWDPAPSMTTAMYAVVETRRVFTTKVPTWQKTQTKVSDCANRAVIIILLV